MRSIHLCTAMLAMALTMASPAHAETSCGFMTVDQVDELLAPYRPWQVSKGGAGFCEFTATRWKGPNGQVTRIPATLSIGQQYWDSKREAAKFTQMTRTESATAGKIITRLSDQGAGAESFTYASKLGPVYVLHGTGHANKAVVSVDLVTPASLLPPDDERAMFAGLMAAATRSSTPPEIATKTAQCPHFDPALLRKILPGTAVTIQQHGTDNCMAHNGGDTTVAFQRRHAQTTDDLKQSIEHGLNNGLCKTERLAQFGAAGLLSYECTVGARQAGVSFVKGLDTYKFTVVMEHEPTAKDRAALIALAKQRWDQP